MRKSNNLSSTVFINRKVKDVSNATIFFKHISIYIIVFILLSVIAIFGLFYGYRFYYNNYVSAIASEAALNTIEYITDTENADVDNTYILNYLLAKSKCELEKERATKDSSFFLYDLTEQKCIATSYAIIDINDDSLRDWAEIPDSIPVCPFKITESLIEYCDNGVNTDAHITLISQLNGRLIPEIVTSKSGTEWNEMKRADENRKIYDIPVKLNIVGNRETDPSYYYMKNYAFRQINEGHINVIYDNIPTDLVVISKTFIMNGQTYQLDVGYNYNFFAATIQYIALLELALLIVCALLSYLKMREYRSIYS